jgi:hypothetical protein
LLSATFLLIFQRLHRQRAANGVFHRGERKPSAWFCGTIQMTNAPARCVRAQQAAEKRALLPPATGRRSE